MAIAASLASVSASSCSYISGNYYCSKTTKVTYEGIGYSGTYKDVTAMDEDSGTCSQSSTSFSGNMSPLDEELSLHFRGPLQLLQFGVYYPYSSSSSKREDTEEEEDCSTTQHVHHKHNKRATAYVTQTVVVDQYGNTVTSTGTATATTATADDESTELTKTKTTSVKTSTASSGSTSSSSSSTASSGDWERVAYFKPGTADNCTFLNHYGGSGSGVWSSAFGNSLSYMNSDNSGASSSAITPDNITVSSNSEFVIMSGSECPDSSTSGSCGYYRDGIPAYHGFGGNTKIFVFEFLMPSDSSSSGTNADMPAIWALNAKIPRTLQYGASSCSCWSTGCGELDLFEILSTGSDKLISHLHDGQGNDGSSSGGGGSSDYFARPTSSSVKAAVIFSGTDIVITYVDEDFDSVLSSDTVNSWLEASGSTATISS